MAIYGNGRMLNINQTVFKNQLSQVAQTIGKDKKTKTYAKILYTEATEQECLEFLHIIQGMYPDSPCKMVEEPTYWLIWIN